MRAGDVVSLRVRTPEGVREVVGTLVAASPTAVSVRRRDGSVAQIDVDAVEAGRVVPPGPARAVSVRDLEAVMADGWRALETERLGPWLLRAGGGFTGRANSALVTADEVDLAASLAAVVEWYAARGLRPQLQVPSGDQPAGLDALLDEQGWTASAPALVMTAEAGHVLRVPTPDVTVRLDEEPDEAWLAAFRQQEGPLPAAARAVLTNHPQARFASVRDGDRCLAITRVAVDGRWAGVFAVEVVPEQRRGGLATALSVAALRWAVNAGARRTYLQVRSGNDAAIALWHRLGYAVHHDYRYWSGPVA